MQRPAVALNTSMLNPLRGRYFEKIGGRQENCLKMPDVVGKLPDNDQNHVKIDGKCQYDDDG